MAGAVGVYSVLDNSGAAYESSSSTLWNLAPGLGTDTVTCGRVSPARTVQTWSSLRPGATQSCYQRMPEG
jgi:hypothetical protein